LRYVILIVLLAWFPALAGDVGDSLVVPGLVGQDMYHANRALRRLGLTVRFEQVQTDTAAGSFFLVTAQAPDSGLPAKPGDTVLLRFNCPGMLRYWNASVLPLVGDLANAVDFYRVSKPPHPVKVAQAEYPPELGRYNFRGETDVEALVDFDGSVLAARVARSSGYEAADSSACEAALRTGFTPGEYRDQPVRVWFPLPYHWRFEEAPQLPASDRPAAPGTNPVEP